MLKLNLSPEKDNEKPRETLLQNQPDPAAFRTNKETGTKIPLVDKEIPPKEIPKAAALPEKKMKGTGFRIKKRPLLIGLILLLALGLGYFRGGYLLKLFSPQKQKINAVSPPVSKQKENAEHKAPPSGPAKPISSADSSEKKAKPSVSPAMLPNDPALAALDRIGGATPSHLWLTETDIRANGAYEIKGISFAYASMDSFLTALESMGSVTGKNLPKASKSPDTIYTFAVSGKLSGAKASEILDVIPPETLVSLGDSLKFLAEHEGAAVLMLPQKDRAFQDNDLPFQVEGSFSGTKKMLDELTGAGKNRIYRLVIRPAGNSGVFNRIRASFSLRTLSSI
jgi:hypothetical protein